ncbi:predicted protein [Postia placenta Mad-698-R]|nr:predicted protein [Postia placenta Mad-698-R]
MSLSSMEEAKVLLFSHLVGEYIKAVGISMFVYDAIISFNLEWRAVWSRKITGATALYLALRYTTFVNIISNVVESTMTSCEAAFASIRVYAIDGRRWTKAVIVMMLGLAPVAINIGIAPLESHSLPPRLTFFLVSRSCVLISNLLVVVSTWQATHASRAVTAWTSRGSLTAVLFRDGTVHFALVVGLNAANIVVKLVLGKLIDLSEPVELISTVVLCRFFLNLRHFSSPDVDDSTISSRGSSFSSFASRIIGNLGEMLEDEPGASDDDLEGELDGLNDATQVDGAVDLSDSAKSPSDADKALTRTATTAVCKQETGKEGAAGGDLAEALDEGFDQRMIDIV